MAKTVEEIQARLKTLGFDPGLIDGLGGERTSRAVAAFQQSKGIAETGKVDPGTLKALFPQVEITGPNTIKAKLTDWLLNMVTSKINGVAAAMVAAIAVWVTTKFGITIDDQVKDAVTLLLTSAAGGLILILRTFFNNPRVTTKQPAVVQQPAEHTR